MVNSQGERLDNYRVLVVDDDKEVLKLFQEILETMNFQVTTAKDGLEAKLLCRKESFDVVFVDIFLPRISGLELVDVIKLSQPDTPVVIITGMPSLNSAITALRANVFDYLVKPIRSDKLMKIARRAIRSKKQREIADKEKKRLESIAEASNLMDNIGFIFSGIRHELGNPINAIKMTLSVLNENLESFSRERIRVFVQRALQDIGRVEYLLKMLKNFNMFEDLIPQEENLAQFMEKFVSLISHDLEMRGINMEVVVPEDIGTACLDSRALHQVLLNLVTNAADACEAVDEPKIEIALAKTKGMIIIKVKDNGCGIPEEDQPNLFKPFFSTKPNGTGLGLAIVKRMVTSMRGTIEIESQVGSGTVATLVLPA